MPINDYGIVADLYDIYVPATYDIDFFLEETKKATGEVLELMSGTGRVSIPLLQAGVHLTCVDISAELNAVFQSRLDELGLQADIYTMDVCALDLPKQFSMVIIPFYSFAHITSPESQRQALRHIRRHLAPGGTFICTLGNPGPRQKSVDGNLRLFRKYPLPAGETLLLWIQENWDPDDAQVVDALQFFEEYDAAGTLQSKRLLELHFRLTGREEFEKMAGEAGFRVKAFYGDYARSEFDPESSPAMLWLMEAQ